MRKESLLKTEVFIMSRSVLADYSRILFETDNLENKSRFVWFARVLGTVVILNVLDGIFTLFWVLSGKAVETNPIMDLLLGIHPVLFISLKLALVNLGCILLLRFYTKSFALMSSLVAFGVYGAILVYHSAMVLYLH